MFLQRRNFAKMISESLILKEKSHKLVEFSENIYSVVHRFLLAKNAEGENQRIGIHLLETKQAIFHLHVSLIAEEKINIQRKCAYTKSGANATGL